jgi:hypothetical protein
MPKNDFSELDYQPKKKSGLLLPVLVLITVFALMTVLIVNLGTRNEALIDSTDDEVEEQLEEKQPEEIIPVTEEASAAEEEPTGIETDEEAETDYIPPDYDQLEEAMHSWLITRIGDPDVIMVHTSELDDVENFFGIYDLEEDNIIVYQLESTEDQFATAAFGLPYSEWSIRAVFIWSDQNWSFLREELLQ